MGPAPPGNVCAKGGSALENKGYYLNALPERGEVTLLAVVTEKTLRPKRNAGVYLHLRLADRTGELDAKVWERPEEIAQTFGRDHVVKVRGTIEEYNDKPQLVVTRIRQCEPDEFRPEDFCPSSEGDPEVMYGQLLSYVEMVERPPLRELLRSIVGDPAISAKLKVTPAALKIHHACRSGLLEHVVSLCELATMLAGKYARLQLDWLLAGAVLHDLGKIETLEITGVRFDYTARGQLVEHITLSLEIPERYIAKQADFPIEIKTVLQHLIVSHHGELDKGALRLPMMPEAMVLNLVDLLDARMEQAFRLIDQAPAEEKFTAYIPSLGRQLFRKFGGQNGQQSADSGLKGAETGGKAA
jgi:3'-5' exoribonuclease